LRQQEVGFVPFEDDNRHGWAAFLNDSPFSILLSVDRDQSGQRECHQKNSFHRDGFSKSDLNPVGRVSWDYYSQSGVLRLTRECSHFGQVS